MRIGIVGGLDRNARDLESIAQSCGHEIELHTGGLTGPASAAGLRAMVMRADLVVVLTDVNSHNGVRMARRYARLKGTPVRLLRRLGAAQFPAFLRALPTRVSKSGPQPGGDWSHRLPSSRLDRARTLELKAHAG